MAEHLTEDGEFKSDLQVDGKPFDWPAGYVPVKVGGRADAELLLIAIRYQFDNREFSNSVFLAVANAARREYATAGQEENTVDKFVSPCPPPNALEREILDIIQEECAEVIQRVSKILRFGLEDIQQGHHFNNSARLAGEIGDLFGILDLAIQEGIVSAPIIEGSRNAKKLKLAKYLQNSPPIKYAGEEFAGQPAEREDGE